MPSIFDPLKVGALTLRNRIVMAPLTRARSGVERVPGPLVAEYYAQRASAGLIISEATSVTPFGVGYVDTPGIWSDQQVEGWKLTTQAVHKAGGLIFLQLWHVGRISDPSLLDGQPPVSASAIAAKGDVSLLRPKRPYPIPHPLSLDEIQGVVEAYRQGAENAKQAGFDGVELHGANGYLLDQFLQDGSNKRTDAYGGPIENRVRLPLEVLDAIIGAWSADRVGIRLSPHGTFGDMFDSNADALFSHMIRETSKRNIAYLHLIEPRATLAGGSDATTTDAPDVVAAYRSLFAGKVIAAGGFTAQSAETEVATGRADAVAFGRLFISNPDLVERIRHHQELARYNRATFYGGAEVGYTDYPALQTA